MNKFLAFETIDQYFCSWRRNNIFDFLGTLDDEVVITACTGDVYSSVSAAELWFKGWFVNENKVEKWDIQNYYFDTVKEVVIAQWSFACQFENQAYEFDGVSIVKFRAGKIIQMDEFKMDAPKNTLIVH